jgi:hypothetical protein
MVQATDHGREALDLGVRELAILPCGRRDVRELIGPMDTARP